MSQSHITEWAKMSPWHITEWATNVTSCICHDDIFCSLSYKWWWHLLLTQLYVMVTFVAHSVICEQQMSPWHITKWATNVTITYNWVSNKCRHDRWHLLLTQIYVMVTFVAHSVICHGNICCSLSYMAWWTEWATNVTMTYNWVSNKCHNHI
jgi:hypothetical protein